ncbi:hypothetical protein N656DRAFT_736088, partial [Canariomyces notabilis]
MLALASEPLLRQYVLLNKPIQLDMMPKPGTSLHRPKPRAELNGGGHKSRLCAACSKKLCKITVRSTYQSLKLPMSKARNLWKCAVPNPQPCPLVAA